MNQHPVEHLTEDEAKEQAASRRRAVQYHNDSNQRAIKSLFRDPREMQLSAEVAADCSRRGIVNQYEVLEAQAKARAEHVPLWRENPGMSVQLDREIRAGRSIQTPPNDEEKARRVDMLRRPIYRTAKQVGTIIEAEKAANRATPILNAIMHGPAGSAAPVVKARLEARAEEIAANSTRTASKRGILG